MKNSNFSKKGSALVVGQMWKDSAQEWKLQKTNLLELELKLLLNFICNLKTIIWRVSILIMPVVLPKVQKHGEALGFIFLPEE